MLRKTKEKISKKNNMSAQEKSKFKVVFMGTSDFAADILKALVKANYNLVTIYTRADSKIGRKQEINETPIKQIAQEKNLLVLQPEKFTPEVIAELENIKPDLIVVAAYGKILPKRVLEIPKFGCLNVHPSLLPKFRGPSPVQNTLLFGAKQTGTTIMLMDAGMDSGDILAQEKIDIKPKELFPQLLKRLALLSAELLEKTIPLWLEKKIETEKQNPQEATLCQLIERGDGKINWNQEAYEIFNQYRALYPWPGVFTFWESKENLILRLKLTDIDWKKDNSSFENEIGKVFQKNDSIGVQTLQGVILLNEVQLEGKKSMKIKDFLNGYPDFLNSFLK